MTFASWSAFKDWKSTSFPLFKLLGLCLPLDGQCAALSSMITKISEQTPSKSSCSGQYLECPPESSETRSDLAWKCSLRTGIFSLKSLLQKNSVQLLPRQSLPSPQVQIYQPSWPQKYEDRWSTFPPSWRWPTSTRFRWNQDKWRCFRRVCGSWLWWGFSLRCWRARYFIWWGRLP